MRELLLAEVMRTTWAIEPAYGQRVFDVVSRWARHEPAPDGALREAKAVRDSRDARARGDAEMTGSIAVIPLYGIITPRANLITSYSGGTSCQGFSGMLREAVADPSISQVLIDIDSPGGNVYGVPETASEIMQARTQKPIIGIANHMAASGAYWLGACCTELYVSPSGEVGSIGVYTGHEDVSQQLEKEGVKVTLVSSGKYKTERSPYQPLSDDARAYMQSSTNESYRQFVAAVSRGRGVPIEQVKKGFGEGRLVTAGTALSQGMVDGVKSLGDLIRDMQASPRTTFGSTGRRSGSNLRAQMDAEYRRRQLEIISLT